MTFTAKSEADAYDKMLDMADDLFSLLAQSQLFSDEQQQENLAFYLAQHKDELLQAVGAKAKTAKKDKLDQQTNEIAPHLSANAAIENTALNNSQDEDASSEPSVAVFNQRPSQAA